MGRRTSGNKNNNKAAVYGKRHEEKSNGAQILKAEGVTFPAASEVAVTFLPLSCLCAGRCDGGSLLPLALGVTAAPTLSLLQSSLTHQVEFSRLEQSN